MEFQIKLNTPKDVETIVKHAEKYNCDIDIKNRNRRFTVDACSLLAMLSLDLSSPLIISTNNDELGELFKKDIQEYVME